MSIRSVLTRDLNESIRACLGRAVKISMKCMVRMETKQDKFENRVLAFSACRLFIMTAKVPSRVDHHFHYLDIQAIESKKATEFCLVVNDKRYCFIPADERHNEIDAMIINLGVSIKNIFPTVPLSHIVRKVDVVPARRVQKLYEVARLVEAREPVPCGGFSTQYACMCDYHGLPYREEVAWDVDTIYLSHDSRELSLQDFDHLDPKDLVPIISALEYNTWFTKLRISHLRLSHEAAERLLHVLKKSVSLEEVYLDNTGIKADFAGKLSMALLSNTSSLLTVLDISHNAIEDKGASHLTGPIGKWAKGLRQLHFAHCNLTAKGVNVLCQALTLNRTIANTLTTLDLAGNSLKEDVASLYSFLAHNNSVTSLNVSGCDLLLDSIFGALLRSCTTHLARLDISRNVFNNKKSKDIPPSFKQFFTSTIALKYLNCSGCRMPLEALKNLLLGLACNESTVGVELDLSSNSLGPPGAHVLESCIHGVKCIASLDISDNGLEQDLSGVVTAVSRNKSVRTLKLGRNMFSIKSKHVHHVVEAVVQMIQEEDCMLETLHINDSRLKSDLYSLLNALGSNTCLQTLDISGNLMGDTGARLLSKALQINCRLRQIGLDRNSVTLQGLSDIAYGLQSNHTLKYIPAPLHDLAPCMKVSPERTESVWRRLQDLLHRNTAPQTRHSSQAFRLQQGLLLSSAQQMLDRLVSQIREQVRALREKTSPDDERPDGALTRAEAVCEDAHRCKQLMARFHAVVMEREAAGNPVELRLSQMADQLHSVIAEHIEGTVSRMLEAAETECPHVLLADVQQAIRTSCHERVRLALPADQVRSRLQQGGGTDLADAVNELHLAVAAQVSDRIVDEVIESLSRTYQELTGDVSRKRASTPDVLKSHSKPCDGAGAGADVSEKSSSADTLHLSPPATPQLQVKKMNLHGRKLRPKSVVDSVEGVSAERIPDLLPSLDPCQEEMDTVAELPASSYQLRHLGKARPRRAKTRAPTRAAVVGEEEAELDSGLDVFFQPARSLPSSPLTSPDSETRQLMTTSADNTPHMGLERTWRTAGLRDENGAQGERRSSGAVKKGISSVFSKLAADRVARSREDRDGIVKPGSRKSTDTVDSDSSAGSGSADSFLNHLLSPPVLPPGEDSSEPALRRPAGLGGADLMAEMKKKQEKRASLTPKHTPDEFEERSPVLSPLQGVKSRPVSIKSPTYADDGPPSISPKPGLAARLSKQASPLPGLYRPSPLGPKPRPKSMAGRTENRSSSGGNVSWDETAASPVDASQNSTSQTGRQVADLPGANGAARTGEAASESAREFS